MICHNIVMKQKDLPVENWQRWPSCPAKIKETITSSIESINNKILLDERTKLRQLGLWLYMSFRRIPWNATAMSRARHKSFYSGRNGSGMAGSGRTKEAIIFPVFISEPRLTPIQHNFILTLLMSLYEINSMCVSNKADLSWSCFHNMEFKFLVSWDDFRVNEFQHDI